jgi:hypothetical protein
MMRMATRALERGSLERQPVARAEVLATDATGVLLRTTAWPHPWLTGPFPSPPDRSRRLDTMPLYVREGAGVPMGPVVQ